MALASRIEESYCRICAGGCGMTLEIDQNDMIVQIRGDKSSPMTNGYACFKGLQAEEAHHGSRRLQHSLKRRPDGNFESIPTEQALSEIAEKIGGIISRGGPDAMGMFMGTAAFGSSMFYAMHKNFMEALRSRSLFTVATIDQSAKYVSFDRMGGWAAGIPDLHEMEVLMLFGNNPLVSHYAGSIMGADATKRMKAAKQRGLKLICVDPRESETAKFADVFLQPIPGQDAAIAAGMIRIIFENGWEDKQFCEDHIDAEALERLKAEVMPFDEKEVERRARLEPGMLYKATRMFAAECGKGVVYTGTGTCMAQFSNLAQHLVDCLNVICGRFRRAGDPYRPNPQLPYIPAHAEVIPPPRSYQQFPPSRIRESTAGLLLGEKPTSTLADEILEPGEGQVRGLLVVAGNPVSCVPDQRQMTRALQDLELLVVVDPYLTSSGSFADYIIAPTLQYEHGDLPYNVMGWSLYPDCWCRYTPPILKPAVGSDVVNDWYVLWKLAKDLGLQLSLNGSDLNMKDPPEEESLFETLLDGSIASLDDLKRHPKGRIYSNPDWKVLEPRPEALGNRFDVMPPDVADELKDFLSQAAELDGHSSNGRTFTHLLSTRRRRDYYNSIGQFLSKVSARNPYNPAFLNPDDLRELGLADGHAVTIESDNGRIHAFVESDETVKPGVISMSHGCGGLPDPDAEEGDMVGVLISSTRNVEPINAQPRMSGIPVNIIPKSRNAETDANTRQ